MSNGFIQFGDGEPIPVTDISIEWKREPLPDEKLARDALNVAWHRRLWLRVRLILRKARP